MPGPEQASTIAETSAFKNCSSTTLERIYSEGNLVLFSVGQALSTSSIIPNRVLIILKGTVRLLGKHNGQLNSLTKLEVGEIVGLASLLRADPRGNSCSN